MPAIPLQPTDPATAGFQPTTSALVAARSNRRLALHLASSCKAVPGMSGRKWVTGNPRQDKEAMGRRFGTGALEALERAEPIRTNSLSMRHDDVRVVLDPYAPFQELKRRLKKNIAANDWNLLAYGDAMVIARRERDFEHSRV